MQLPPDLQALVELIDASKPPRWVQLKDAARLRTKHLLVGCGPFIQPLNRVESGPYGVYVVQDGFICSVCGARRPDA